MIDKTRNSLLESTRGQLPCDLLTVFASEPAACPKSQRPHLFLSRIILTRQKSSLKFLFNEASHVPVKILKKKIDVYFRGILVSNNWQSVLKKERTSLPG